SVTLLVESAPNVGTLAQAAMSRRLLITRFSIGTGMESAPNCLTLDKFVCLNTARSIWLLLDQTDCRRGDSEAERNPLSITAVPAHCHQYILLTTDCIGHRCGGSACWQG